MSDPLRGIDTAAQALAHFKSAVFGAKTNRDFDAVSDTNRRPNPLTKKEETEIARLAEDLMQKLDVPERAKFLGDAKGFLQARINYQDKGKPEAEVLKRIDATLDGAFQRSLGPNCGVQLRAKQ